MINHTNDYLTTVNKKQHTFSNKGAPLISDSQNRGFLVVFCHIFKGPRPWKVEMQITVPRKVLPLHSAHLLENLRYMDQYFKQKK